MKIDIVTVFPEMFSALDYGIVGRAQKRQLISLSCWNPRDFSADKTGRVDDKPYGGGPGMVMQVQPLRACINHIKNIKNKDLPNNNTKTIYLSPQGKLITQKFIRDFIKNNNTVILVTGRYEGIDERIIERDIDEEWSIGNYVLSGGELAAMVVIDAMTRLLPGTLGDAESALQDSFSGNNEGKGELLDYPHYTRPEEIDGQMVPDVLKSGDHGAILKWRQEQALVKTRLKRPDLLKDL